MAKADPHLWLEEVSGEKCLHWAKEPLASWDSWEVKRRDEILGKMPTTKGWQRKVRTGSPERISQGEPLNIYKPVDCLVQSHTTYMGFVPAHSGIISLECSSSLCRRLD